MTGCDLHDHIMYISLTHVKLNIKWKVLTQVIDLSAAKINWRSFDLYDQIYMKFSFLRSRKSYIIGSSQQFKTLHWIFHLVWVDKYLCVGNGDHLRSKFWQTYLQNDHGSTTGIITFYLINLIIRYLLIIRYASHLWS